MTDEEMRRRAMMTEKTRLKLWEVEKELAEAGDSVEADQHSVLIAITIPGSI
jgi:hypothetical protein